MVISLMWPLHSPLGSCLEVQSMRPLRFNGCSPSLCGQCWISLSPVCNCWTCSSLHICLVCLSGGSYPQPYEQRSTSLPRRRETNANYVITGKKSFLYWDGQKYMTYKLLHTTTGALVILSEVFFFEAASGLTVEAPPIITWFQLQ